MAGYRRNGGHDNGDLMLLPLTCVPHLGPSPIVRTYELSLARIPYKEKTRDIAGCLWVENRG